MGAHLQEGKDLLFVFSIHIPFLKELKTGDEAATWAHVPAMNRMSPRGPNLGQEGMVMATITPPQREVRIKRETRKTGKRRKERSLGVRTSCLMEPVDTSKKTGKH